MSERKGKLKRKRIMTTNGLSMYTRFSIEPMPTNAPTVVLVHGLSVSSGYMMPTAVRLAPYYHVYLPDLPGFGRSAKPSHILNVTELADALAAWMQTMELPSATFLGNSMGCQVIVNFALRYPQCIERAILVSPTMDPKARTIHQEARRLLSDTPCRYTFCLSCFASMHWPVSIGPFVRSNMPLRTQWKSIFLPFTSRPLLYAVPVIQLCRRIG